jgi:hypothetical protein
VEEARRAAGDREQPGKTHGDGDGDGDGDGGNDGDGDSDSDSDLMPRRCRRLTPA